MEDSGVRAILVTVPSIEKAEEIAAELVGKKLAACVNIVPGITSIYRWQGKIERDSELLLIIKTTAERFSDLQETVKGLHPYQNPEIIELGINRGAEAYLNWVRSETN